MKGILHWILMSVLGCTGLPALLFKWHLESVVGIYINCGRIVEAKNCLLGIFCQKDCLWMLNF